MGFTNNITSGGEENINDQPTSTPVDNQNVITGPGDFPQTPEVINQEPEKKGTEDVSQNERAALENFFKKLQEAAAAQDLNKVYSLLKEAESVFTPEVMNNYIKPKVSEIIATIAKGDPVDIIINEILGTVVSGGLSGRLGIGGKNVLRDDAKIPDFTLSFAEVAGKGLLQIASSVIGILGNFFTGIIDAIIPGAANSEFKKKLNEGMTLKQGDLNYDFFRNMPEWLHPLWNVQFQPDGSIKIGEQTTAEKFAETGGNIWGLIVGPTKLFKAVSGALKGWQTKAVDELINALMRLHQGGNYTRTSTVVANIFKNRPGILQKALKTVSANAIPWTGGMTATYAAAEQYAENIFSKHGITEGEVGSEQFADLKYWFAGNYIFTYGIAQALNKYGKHVPVLKHVAGKNKFIDFLLAEAGTLGTIGAGTLDSWTGSLQEFFDTFIGDAIKKYEAARAGRNVNVHPSVGPITKEEVQRQSAGGKIFSSSNNVILGGY